MNPFCFWRTNIVVLRIIMQFQIILLINAWNSGFFPHFCSNDLALMEFQNIWIAGMSWRKLQGENNLFLAVDRHMLYPINLLWVSTCDLPLILWKSCHWGKRSLVLGWNKFSSKYGLHLLGTRKINVACLHALMLDGIWSLLMNNKVIMLAQIFCKWKKSRISF